MTKNKKTARLLDTLSHFFIFFLLVSFVIICGLTLFITLLSTSLDIQLTEENLNVAAKITFLNVLIISAIFTVIDTLRRNLTVKLPIKEIVAAGEKIVNGDYSVKLSHISSFAADAQLNEIIDCFNKMAEELSGVETLRVDFVANVSHEMKTPLAVIQNYATLLENPDLSSEEKNEYAKAISTAARRLSDMMTNILKLNKLENQNIYQASEKYNLSEQLCECLLVYENIWEERGINIETDIEDDVTVNADAELLSLVWNNLLSNAFKFTDDGGTVRLTLAKKGNVAVISVSDSGCGMSPEVGTHIFEKFYQGDTSRATQGNGLGLALVKRVVDIVNGEISVDSTLGIGSTFTVKINAET